MPDPLFLLEATAGAALLAAAIVLAVCWPWRFPAPARMAIGEALGIGVVFFIGCGILERLPRWPAAEPADRLLLIVLPALLVVETIAAFRSVPRWLAWALRFPVAVGIAPVLLYNSVYLADLAGPGSRLWTDGEIVLWLGGLPAALLVAWFLLVRLARRGPKRSVILALAIVCAGAAPAIMVSGSLQGGAVLVPLVGGLLGIAAASCVWILPRGESTAVSLGVVLLFALVVMGRFFAELGNVNAGLLLFAPLLAWLPEFLPGTRARPWIRVLPRVVLVTVPVALAFYLAQ